MDQTSPAAKDPTTCRARAKPPLTNTASTTRILASTKYSWKTAPGRKNPSATPARFLRISPVDLSSHPCSLNKAESFRDTFHTLHRLRQSNLHRAEQAGRTGPLAGKEQQRILQTHGHPANAQAACGLGLWRPQPDFVTSAKAWILAGGAHHSCFTQNVSISQLRLLADTLGLEGTSKNSLLMPDEGIFCGSEERKPSHTLLYGKAFVTKLLREKDRVWCEIGIFRGSLKKQLRKKSEFWEIPLIQAVAALQPAFQSCGQFRAVHISRKLFILNQPGQSLQS